MKMYTKISFFIVGLLGMTLFAGECCAFSYAQIMDTLPSGHKLFRQGQIYEVDGGQYLFRRGDDDNGRSHYVVTEGKDGEKVFSGSPVDFQYVFTKVLSKGLIYSSSSWEKMLLDVNMLADISDPRKAGIATASLFAGRVLLDVSTTMFTGGTAGLGIVDGSKNNFLQFLKQGMIGPKAQNLRAVVAAGERLDYLAELENSWPPDMPEAQELFNIIDKTMSISNLLINAGESYTEVKELTGSQGWSILKDMKRLKPTIALAEAGSKVEFSVLKIGLTWGLSGIEDEFNRYVQTADIHAAVLKTIASKLVEHSRTLEQVSLPREKELKLRLEILDEQKYFYLVLQEMVANTIGFGEYVKGQKKSLASNIAIDSNDLEKLKKTGGKIDEMVDAYLGSYVHFTEMLEVSTYWQATLHAPAKRKVPKGPLPGKAFTEPVTGMEFVWVPGGCYQMGNIFGDVDSGEMPRHEVCVAGFWMGRTEVTQGQWQRIMGNNPSGFKKGVNYPVEQVSWDDAQDYIRKLNNKSGKGYRLPSEAEWEYAAQSGAKQEMYAGGNLDAVAWYDGNSGGSTHPVAQKRANGIGIYDIIGNVLEWCQDWYGRNYYNISPRSNPRGPSTGSDRVVRGGSWNLNAGYCRSTLRCRSVPDNRGNSLGFRLVLSTSQ